MAYPCGMQLAVDTTLVSALSSTGAPRRCQNRAEGAALRQARRAKERTYPELLRPDSRCRLVVLALEVGASARKPWTSCSGWRGGVREVCRLVCAAPCRLPLPGAGPPSWTRAYAASLLALPAHSAAGVDGPPPLVSDVLADGGEPFAARSRVR